MIMSIIETYSGLAVRISEHRIKTLIIIFLSGCFILCLNYCAKEGAPPVVLTVKVTGITTISAIAGGNITYDGGSNITSRGVCWDTVTGPTLKNHATSDGRGTGIFSSNLTNLQPGTLYYVKAYATNIGGTTFGFETAFTTIPVTPTLTTNKATDITTNSSTSGGNIVTDGGYAVIARGVCWDTVSNPTISDSHTIDGTGTGSFESCITDLLPDTRYYVRAYATNSKGTVYGYQVTFMTFQEFTPIIFNPGLTYETVSDIDANNYKTIQIGTQTWMAENLKTTKFNDGTPIPNVTADTIWAHLSTSAYCWSYNNETIFKDMYGAIYNYYAVETGKLCPTGWHVSSASEWDTLSDYLGGREISGGKLKESGTTHWRSPNTGADNVSGFTALPGGERDANGYFWGQAYHGRWWCSDNWSMNWLQYSTGTLDGMSCMSVCGFTVRCVKDK
jgi:uncharacterized protein (TIGR02145 family)